jgi:hypothetical protein
MLTPLLLICSHEIAQARAMPRQGCGVDIPSTSGQAPRQISHLDRRAGNSMNQIDERVLAVLEDEISRLAIHHFGEPVMAIQSLHGHLLSLQEVNK